MGSPGVGSGTSGLPRGAGGDGAPPDAAPFHVVFADTCIGGSTVAARLASTRRGLRAFYLADYAVNPLGVKPRAGVLEALDRWVEAAHGRAPTLIVACNTASVLLRSAPEVVARALGLGIRIHSMVDLVESLIRTKPEEIDGRRVCLMGTEFTVAQSVYTELLRRGGAAGVLPLPATRTERAIAHLRHHDPVERQAIAEEIGPAIREADSVILACTCFPLVGDLIRDINPGIRLLDPARGVDELALEGSGEGPNRLTVAITGEGLSPDALRAQAPTLFPGWRLEEVVRI